MLSIIGLTQQVVLNCFLHVSLCFVICLFDKVLVGFHMFRVGVKQHVVWFNRCLAAFGVQQVFTRFVLSVLIGFWQVFSRFLGYTIAFQYKYTMCLTGVQYINKLCREINKLLVQNSCQNVSCVCRILYVVYEVCGRCVQQVCIGCLTLVCACFVEFAGFIV